MKKKMILSAMATGAAAVLVATTACARSSAKGENTTRTSESAVVTNDNGSVSRTFVESNVATNGNMVTERRRETRTTTDTEGNVLETSTSEYAQSYPVGDFPLASRPSSPRADGDCEGGSETSAEQADSFMGLKFDEVFESTNFVNDADEPALLRAAFVPKKALAGFDDYYVYVTPKSHKVAKVFACAKEAVEPGARWRRHYLIEALEKRYQTWARLCSFRRPCYTFDIGSGRHVTACLAGAGRDYETVLAAWDDDVLDKAAEEIEELREEARKNAYEKRRARVSDAADAF
jgi:hypothetical protein